MNIENKIPVYLESALDRAINEFSKKTNELKSKGLRKSPEQVYSEKLFIRNELNYIKTLAQVQAGLQKYKSNARNMTEEQLESEIHDSVKLGKHLRASGRPKPDDRVDAHAIVSGGHTLASQLRAVMAMLSIRVDDPDNGMWMPRRSCDTPHWAFPKCPPHSRIHRFNYYFWVQSLLIQISDEVIFRHTLRMISRQIEQGTYPEFVMKRKDDGIACQEDL